MTDETAKWQNDSQLSGSARIDLACDDFETAWKENRHPSLEGYLLQLPAENRDTVFRELLTVELSYRKQSGDTPSRDEYQVRFPDYAALIDELFQKLIPPERLGDYELLDKLGKGGMGVVHKARHRMLDRIVAVKVLPENCTEDDQTLSRFHREMKLIARLDHVNIVRAHDAREENGVHYLVMEYVDGVNLHELVSHLGPLPIGAACEIIRQVALALHHAYEHGLVHRDMKPSNVMLSRSGEVKLLDLGLARLAAENQQTRQLTEAGFAMGTVDYMAPEQWEDSSAVDIRADIYSLGCTLFFLLTGNAPYSGPQYSTARKKLMAHAAAAIPYIRPVRSDVPDDLDETVHWTMAKEPDDRPTTPAELADALAEWADISALADLLHDEFDSEGGALTRHLRSPGETTPAGRGSSRSRGAAATRKSSRWMRTTHRRRDAIQPWYRRPAIVLPAAAVLLGLLGWLISFGMEDHGSLDPTVQERLVQDVVLAPGPYGGWWFEETPWLMPSLRARLLEAIDAGRESIGDEDLRHLESISRASNVDTYNDSLRGVARALLSEAEDKSPTDQEADLLLSDKSLDLPEDDFRERLRKLLAKLRSEDSEGADTDPVLLHEQAVILHYLGEWTAADYRYQQAIDAYAQAEPPLDSLAVLCQADRAMLAFHRSDFVSAEKQFEALRLQNLGPALELHARCYEIDALRKQKEYSDAHDASLAAAADLAEPQEFALASQHPLRAYLLERDAWNELDWGHLSVAIEKFKEANRLRAPSGPDDLLNQGNSRAYAFNLQGAAMAKHFLGDPQTAAEFAEIVSRLTKDSSPSNTEAQLGWEQRLQLRERLPNTYERMADEYIYGRADNLAQAQKALQEALTVALQLSFDLDRRWPHVNRTRYKLAMVQALQPDETGTNADEARRLIASADQLEARMSQDGELPENIVALYAPDRRLAMAVLALHTGDATQQTAARDDLLTMVREANPEDVDRSNIEPLLMAVKQLAQSAELSLNPQVEMEELRARLDAITADLRHSPEDRDRIRQGYLAPYYDALTQAARSPGESGNEEAAEPAEESDPASQPAS